MKWAVLIPRFLPEKVGGNFVYVDRFAENLASMGHEVHVLTTTLDGSLPEREEKNGAVIHRLLVPEGNVGPLRFSTMRDFTEFFNIIDGNEKFDIANIHSAYMLDLSGIRSGLKLIFTLHAVVTYEYLFGLKKTLSSRDFTLSNIKNFFKFPFKYPVSLRLERIAVERAEKVIVMSEYVKNTVLSFFPGTEEKKIFVSRIGIDPAKFELAEDKTSVRTAIGVGEEDILFFTVRRLHPRMGLENLIRAFAMTEARLQRKTSRLFIAGKGQLKKRLESLVAELGLADKVKLLGFVSDEDLVRYFKASDVFVIPTEELEGFGIATIEALACDLPVIATPVGANPEVAGAFYPELVSRSREPEDIAEKIDYFIRERERYTACDNSGKINTEYSWKGIISDIETEIGIK